MDVVVDRVLGRTGLLVGATVGWFSGWSWWDKMLMEPILVLHPGPGSVSLASCHPGPGGCAIKGAVSTQGKNLGSGPDS